MESPFANLLLKLQEKLKDDVEELRMIDQDWNQLDFATPPVSYPCALIDFVNTDFTQRQGYQDGRVRVRVKLIYRSFTSTSSITPEQNREQALNFYEVEQKIYESLQGWYAEDLLVNAMIRVNAFTDKRDDGLRVRVIDFDCTFADSSVST